MPKKPKRAASFAEMSLGEVFDVEQKHTANLGGKSSAMPKKLKPGAMSQPIQNSTIPAIQANGVPFVTQTAITAHMRSSGLSLAEQKRALRVIARELK